MDLAAHPERYSGKRVQIVGYLKYDDEHGPFLFHTKAHAEQWVSKDSLFLEPTERDLYRNFDEAWVFVEGEFDSGVRGLWGNGRGGLVNIERLELNNMAAPVAESGGT